MTSPLQGRGSVSIAIAALLLAGSLGSPRAGAAAAGDPAPVSWTAQSRSTAYFRQEAPPGTADEEDRLPFYQNVDLGVGNLATGHLDLRFSGRYAEDFRVDEAIDQNGKWFVGYAQYRLDAWHTRIRGGRQFLQEGTLYSTLDGGWISLQPHRRLGLRGWAGATAPTDRDFAFEDDFRYGGRVMWTAHPRFRLEAWSERRVRDDRTLSLPVGGQVVARPTRTVRALARGSYDLDRGDLSRVDLMLNWRHRHDWPTVDVQYLARSQEYESGSWWERFRDELYSVQLLRGSVRWTDERGVGGEVQAFGSFVDERRTGQVGAAFLAPHLRFGVGYLDGDAGEQFRLYGDVNYQWREMVDLSAGAHFVEYALVSDPTSDQQRDLTSYFVRAAWVFVPGARLTSELQVLDNPVYESDIRLLVGLDLFAGRGASNYGLGTGGMN